MGVVGTVHGDGFGEGGHGGGGGAGEGRDGVAGGEEVWDQHSAKVAGRADDEDGWEGRGRGEEGLHEWLRYKGWIS